MRKLASICGFITVASFIVHIILFGRGTDSLAKGSFIALIVSSVSAVIFFISGTIDAFRVRGREKNLIRLKSIVALAFCMFLFVYWDTLAQLA